MTTTQKKGRPKGSKNIFTKQEVEKLQEKVNELEKQYNSYDDVLSEFVDGFILETTKNIKTIDMTTLQKWFMNPDQYMDEITNILTYYYIIDGNIAQLYDILFSLPQLNYKIKTLKRTESYKDDIFKIKIALERTVGHKQLTRQLLVQMAHNGCALGTWLGDKRNPYLKVFDNLEYCYPYGVYNGKMVGVFDLSYIDDVLKDEVQKQAFFMNMKPFITKSMYDKWKNCSDANKKLEYQLIVLPPEKSLVARNRILSANQRLGIPQGTQAIMDLQHKQKMKELERAIADKIIRAIAVVKFKGKDDNDIKVKDATQKRVFNSVKKALEKNTNEKGGLTCIGLPDFASFEYPDIKNGDKVLTPDKYDSVNSDITTATGMSSVFTNGTGGNYSSANINLQILYRKIGSMLEQIEEIYNQLIIIILGKSKGENYVFEYDKDMPLTRTEKIKIYQSLSDKGYAIKPLLDEIGEDFEYYIEESIYEINELKLREKIVPSLSTYTTTKGDIDNKTKEKIENPTNENTISTQGNGDNLTPSPSD